MKRAELKTKFPGLILPDDYHPVLETLPTAHALNQLKNFFQLNLETELYLHRVSAPLFVKQGTGINDDLSGVEKPVSFPVTEMEDTVAEVVQSLAKWKRMALPEYGISVNEGIYTDMHAIRPDEVPDNLHSLFVDQWDWEQRIAEKDRNLGYLKQTVQKLYAILQRTENYIYKLYGIKPALPKKIHFIHAEDLLQLYPGLTPKEREGEIVKQYGAVFLIGIGHELSHGEPHDGRSPDYDDWSTKNSEGYYGLNGDILIWHPVLNCAFEVSSMGIRVSKEALEHQLALKDQNQRKELEYHEKLLSGDLPLSIGGGIGQSRLGMYFLRKAHVGEVSAGIWPAAMKEICKQHRINLI